MSFKVFVLLVTLFCAGTAYTDEEVSIVIKEIEVIGTKLNYPRVAIDKVASVFKQTLSQNKNENRLGLDEEVYLLVEGSLYQTKKERYLSGDTKHYDVRAVLKRMSERNSVDTSSWKQFDEEKLEILRAQIVEEFPYEVAEQIVNITRDHGKSTPKEAEKRVIDRLTLLMDGAVVETLNKLNKIQEFENSFCHLSGPAI